MHASDYINLIRRDLDGRNQAMGLLYQDRKLRDNTVKFVLAKGGTREEADTIFCDTIVNFVKACYRPDFEIKSNLENYFFGVTRNLWYRTLRERDKTTNTEDIPEEVDSETPEILLLQGERKEFLRQILALVDAKCRKVLTLWAHNVKMKAIAAKMAYSSAEVVRKKKHFCLKKLIALVNEHPDYRDALKVFY